MLRPGQRIPLNTWVAGLQLMIDIQSLDTEAQPNAVEQLQAEALARCVDLRNG